MNTLLDISSHHKILDWKGCHVPPDLLSSYHTTSPIGPCNVIKLGLDQSIWSENRWVNFNQSLVESLSLNIIQTGSIQINVLNINLITIRKRERVKSKRVKSGITQCFKIKIINLQKIKKKWKVYFLNKKYINHSKRAINKNNQILSTKQCVAQSNYVM